MFLSIYFFQFICFFQFIYIKDFFIYLSYNLERQIIFIQSSEADSKSSDGILAQFLQWIKSMSRVFIEKVSFCLGRKSCPKVLSKWLLFQCFQLGKLIMTSPSETFCRSSHIEVFFEKGVLKICNKFIEEHPR